MIPKLSSRQNPRVFILLAALVIFVFGLPPARGAEPTASPAAVPTAIPAASPAATPNLAPLPVAENDTPVVPVVLRVSRYVGDKKRLDADPALTVVERGDDIYVHVQMLDEWIKSVKNKVPDSRTDILDLMLYLNGSPLKGVHPTYFFAYPEQLSVLNDAGDPVLPPPIRPVHYLRFHLECTPESKGAWQQLLRRPDFDPRVLEVSVGFTNSQFMRTYVAVDRRQQFCIVALPPARFWLGVATIVICLAAFFKLAHDTDIIRDTDAPLRPDERRPYSLARTQMAFWFFLVLSSFCFLWVLTGSMDTLNSSVLTLLGISAGTALGAAFVDTGTDPGRARKSGPRLPVVDLSRPKVEIRDQIAEQLTGAETRLTTLEAARETVDAHDRTAKDASEADIKAAADEVERLRKQEDYFRWPAWKGMLYDLLVEDGFISFHRFQMVVWTAVLGGMFVAGVYSETIMPEFSATLLGLLGISGGTYIGFKLPATTRDDPGKRPPRQQAATRAA